MELPITEQIFTELDHEHEWLEIGSDPNSELISLFCTHCGVGANVSPENLPLYKRTKL